MEEVFANLERIQSLITKDPGSFKITNSDIIFSLLEENEYQAVINQIKKAEAPPGPKRKRSDSPQVRRARHRSSSRSESASPRQGYESSPGTPVQRSPSAAELRRMRSPGTSYRSPSASPRSTESRRMRSPRPGTSSSSTRPLKLMSDNFRSPSSKSSRRATSPTVHTSSPKPGGSRSNDSVIIVEDDSPRPNERAGITAYEGLRKLAELRSIFSDKSVDFLKAKISQYRDHNTEALVNIILEDPEMIESPVKRARTNGDASQVVCKSLADLKGETANITLDEDMLKQAEEAVNVVDTEPWAVGFFLPDLLGIFPHLDPEYLTKEAARIGDDDGMQQEFINKTVGKSGLPSRKDYDARVAKRQEIYAISKLRVSDFLRDYDDPVQHFNSLQTVPSTQYKECCKKYLRKKFPNVDVKELDRILDAQKHRFLPALKALKEMPANRRGKKGALKAVGKEEMDPTLLKEYIFYKLEDKIKEAKQREVAAREELIAAARENGALFQCECCFDDECLLAEVVMCPTDHMFCRDCLRRGSEVEIGDNKTTVACFNQECDSEFNLQVLEEVLRPRVLKKLVERRAAEDVSKAGIQNLVQCPACNYAVIMPDSEKLIRCGAADCGKVSCRLCREESHLPLRCEEVEKDVETKARTKLENAMTEAMVRQCPKCKNRFFKTEGCNLMHCSCGATMCYLCRKEVPDNYKHFYGQGGSPKPGLCPLYSDNKNLHKAEVLSAAEKAGAGLKLKHDPTKNIDKPPRGFDPTRIHTQPEFGEDDSDSDGYSDDDDDEDDDHLYHILQNRNFVNFVDEDIEDEEDLEEEEDVDDEGEEEEEQNEDWNHY